MTIDCTAGFVQAQRSKASTTTIFLRCGLLTNLSCFPKKKRLHERMKISRLRGNPRERDETAARISLKKGVPRMLTSIEKALDVCGFSRDSKEIKMPNCIFVVSFDSF